MTGPGSDTDDTDMDQPTIEAKRQENTNSPQNKTAVMAEQETKDNKKTGPSSRNDTDNTDNDTDMGQPTKEAKRQGDSKTLSKNMYKVTSAISAGTSEETSDSTFYRTPPTTFLTDHLKPHKKTGPSSSSDPDNTDNDTDMGQPTKEAERQENTNSPQNRRAIMAEQKTEDNKWVLQYYNPTLTCHKCNVCFSSDNDNILSSKETLTKLKDHLLHKHKLNYDSMIEHNMQHNVNKEQIPVRDFIRKHYTKLRGDTVRCNYCFEVISYTYMNYSSLHDHLKCEHDKLTEVEENDINFPWYWDYFTPIDPSGEAISAECNICNSPCYTFPTTFLTEHLKIHKITSPSLSRDTDDTNIATDMGTSTQEAKLQGDSKALSNNMYKMTLATSAGTSEETSSHNEPSSSSSYGYDMDFSAQHQSQSFGAIIPLSEQIRDALDAVNENVPSTSESTVSFDQPDFDSVASEAHQRL